MGRVLRKQLLLQFVDAVKVALAIEVCTYFHCLERSPALRIYDVSILERFLHVIGHGEASAGFSSVLLCYLNYIAHYFVSFRMSKDYIHSETCEKSDDALRYRERLAV